MQKAMADTLNLAPHGQNDVYRAVVSDLVSPIGHVQTSRRLIERVIAGEMQVSAQQSSDNVVVLDDVSPRYAKATTALQVCDANPGAALRSLTEASTIEAYVATAPAPSAVGA